MEHTIKHSIKNIRKTFRDNGVFYTPPELAYYLKSFLPDDVDEIYDPTCGDGGLLYVFDESVKKYGQEIDESQAKIAQERLANAQIIAGDTLTNPAFIDRKFKYIIANPPFSLKWEPKSDERFAELPALPPKSKADFAFLAHILYYLADNGTAVVLCSPGIGYRGNAEYKIRKYFVEKNYIDSVIAVEGDKFDDTTIPTLILILKKNRDSDSVRFVDKDKEATIRKNQIVENDFDLSVNTYIPREYKSKIDDVSPVALRQEIQDSVIKSIRTQLELEKMLGEINNVSGIIGESDGLNVFIQKLRAVLDEFSS